MTVAAVELGGLRTFLGVPLLKENEVVGIMFLGRQFVRPFTDKQIELVKNFAAQAVIAIENARLFNELRQSLEQQTATSEVLQVISSSPGELQLVFATMLENAIRICAAKFGTLFISKGATAFRAAVMHNAATRLIRRRVRRLLSLHPITVRHKGGSKRRQHPRLSKPVFSDCRCDVGTRVHRPRSVRRIGCRAWRLSQRS